MSVMNIAIELGTSFTCIYVSGGGVVLREPSVIAFDSETKKIKAVGFKALDMSGKAPDKTVIISPVSDGYISDADACAKMTSEFIKKILPESYIFFPRIKALIAVPTGLSVEERKTYEDVLFKAGASEVYMADNILLTAFGFDLPVNKPAGGLVVNIGGGKTEIAIISLSSSVSGCAVNIGGNMMDKALMDFIIGKYGLKVGINTAKKIKQEIGTLYLNDISSMEVKGINTHTLTPASLNIYATDVYEAIMPYYARISEAISGIINLCPPELAGDIYGMGVFVAGGASKIPGLDKLLSESLSIPVTLSDEAEFVAINGAGRLIEDKQLLREIVA